METVHTDNRRFPRIDDSVCAWLSFKKDNAAYGTTTVDLGAEGARFSTLKNVRVGEHVIVCLQLPWMSIQCKGKICWTGSERGGLSSFGVRFLDLEEHERDYLGRYVDQSTDATMSAAIN